MENPQFLALDKIMPPVMSTQKVYKFIVDPIFGKFMDPDDEDDEVVYKEGLLLENIPLDRFRSAWLKSSQGETFLLDHDYNHYRFHNLQKFMEKNKVVLAPVITLCGTTGAMQFEDGRHRFLWLSIHGYKTFSACVAKHEEVRIRRLLGM